MGDAASTVVAQEKPVSFNLKPVAARPEEEDDNPGGWSTTDNNPEQRGETGKRAAVTAAFKDNSASQQKRKKRLQGVFGMDDDAEEQDNVARDFKLAAAKKGKDRAYAAAPPK